MAETTSIPKRYQHNNFQRIETADINAIATTPLDYDDELAVAILSNQSGVVDGFHVAFSASRIFRVFFGTALWKGRVVKTPSPSYTDKELDENVSSDPRIDVIYISGYTEDDSDSSSKVSLSAYTRTALGGPASIGTGDGTTKAFDLGHSGVDPRTLKVYKDATQVGGWVYSQGTGGSGKDQVIFETAPASSVAVTSDYTHESGGAEGTSSLNTRKTLTPTIAVAKGTPDPSPVAPTTPAPNTDIVLATITVTGSWTGGSITPDNTVKKFILHPDQNVDPACNISPSAPNANAVRSGRVSTLLRNFDQVLAGGRLKYNDTDEIAVTAVWTTLGGQSVHSTAEIALSLQNSNASNPGYVDATGWWYAYLTQATDQRPGEAPSLIVSQNPPNARNREASTNSAAYVGAFYLTAYTPSVVIRPFYTHGDWVFWESPTALAAGAGTNDIDVSAWCPPTGRLLDARVALDLTPGSAGDDLSLAVQSHKSATAKTSPLFVASIEPPTGGGNVLGYATGRVRAEDDSGTRYIHAVRGSSGGTVNAANIFIVGYLDDHRTMDHTAGSASSPTFY